MRLASRFLMGAAIAAAASCLALATPASSAPNYQGLWWNSPPESESGWGINLTHQGDAIFATWFTYDAAAASAGGSSMTANKTAEGTYGGTLIETAGPAFSADPVRSCQGDPNRGRRRHADLPRCRQWHAPATRSRVCRRRSSSRGWSSAPCRPAPTAAQPDFAAATNYQDLWWVANGAESGWGVNLAHQGDDIFATWFTYDKNGAPLWLSATAARIAPNVYRGELNRTTGPAFNAVPFDPANVTRTVVGTATLTFANGNAATFAYTMDGVSQTKTITRLLFVPPAGTLCGEPSRTPAPFTIVAAGDIAQCGNAPAAASAAARTAALVDAQDALVLTLGDNVYDKGKSDEFSSCFQPTWGAFKDRIRPSPGNHDYETLGR